MTWLCKKCSFESDKRTGLLRRRLKHRNSGCCQSVPCLYTDCPCSEKFRRITATHLERTFYSKLDFYTPKLNEMFQTRGGIAGTKIRPILGSLNQVKCNIVIWDSQTLFLLLTKYLCLFSLFYVICPIKKSFKYICS